MNDFENFGLADLSPVDPLRDSLRFDDTVRAIVRDGFDARPHALVTVLGGWMRPALAAAAVIIALSLPVALRAPTPPSLTTAEILGIPRALIDLASTTRQPSLVELARALGTEGTDDR
ncbi:MAG TPA: hypothetical protein VII52_16190 [Gemmatimonadaceae bacterium]